jgi:hypothetical protein
VAVAQGSVYQGGQWYGLGGAVILVQGGAGDAMHFQRVHWGRGCPAARPMCHWPNTEPNASHPLPLYGPPVVVRQAAQQWQGGMQGPALSVCVALDSAVPSWAAQWRQ